MSHPPHPSTSHSVTSDDTHKTDNETPSIDVSILKTVAQRTLIDLLNSVNGAKTLVLDPSLAGPLSLVTDVSLLKHHGVDKMFWLENGPLNATTTNVVYLCRPQIKWMKVVADQIKQTNTTSSSHAYTLVLVPRRTTLCDRILEEEGVLGDLTITSYKLEFIPLEDDLLSLEMDNVWRELYLDHDDTSIFYSAQALLTIQQAYGLFPRILGKGDAAKRLADLLVRSRPPASIRPPSSSFLSETSTIIDSLIIIDRNVDMITPLLTQLTYEGLIDEFYGIQNSHIKIDASLLSQATVPSSSSGGATTTPTPSSPSTSTAPPALSTTVSSVGPKRTYHLRGSDPLFARLRDSNFAVVGPKLSKEILRLDSEYKSRHQAQTVTQLRDFVGKLGGLEKEHQAARLYTALFEEIYAWTRTDQFNQAVDIEHSLLQSFETSSQISAIEDLIARGAPIHLVLRLLCLANLTTGGIKAKTLENLKREILQTYGYEYVPFLLSLTSTSLMTSLPIPKSTIDTPSAPMPPPPFAPIRKAFRLLLEIDETNPADISYVYAGYAPLSIRLVQCIAQKTAVLSSLPPPPSLPDTSNHEGTGAGAGARRGDDEGGGGPRSLKPLAGPISGWKGFEDAVKLIPGATVDIIQRPEGRDHSNPVLQQTTTAATTPPRDRGTTTMVFFIGGCTFTEVSALRWMSRQMRGRRFLIGTTGVVNGSTLLESLGDGPSVKFMSAATSN